MKSHEIKELERLQEVYLHGELKFQEDWASVHRYY